MSFYSDASLVLIPSGYKDQKIYCAKPTDGSADLTFSRASSATRVQSNGLIEKVRSNRFTYSQALANAAWQTTTDGGAITKTANAGTAPDGTNTATRVQIGGGGTYSLVYQGGVNPLGLVVISGYFKRYGGTNQTFRLFGDNGSALSATLTATDTWQRFSYVMTASSTGADGIAADASNNAYDILVWGMQIETGDIATDYIATTTAAVSVGPVSGLPRLDYLGSTCPKLLLEPQRTNLITYSEQLNNAAWAATRAAFTANQTVAPDGYTSADLYTDGTFTGNVSFIEQSVVVGGSGTTYSVFVKKGTANFVQFGFYDTDFHGFVVNTTTWATTHTFGSASSFTATNYGNGWYRLSMYKAAASNTIFVSVAVAANSTGANYNGTGALTAYFWGAQIEAANSTYPTSYIPTLGASVTRVADAASKTGISSLIGQTEGTIFWEGSINTLGSSAQICDLNADGNKYIQIYNSLSGSTPTIGLYIQNVSVLLNIGNIATLTYNTNFKFALGYKNNDYAAYLNGVQVYVNTTIGVPPTSNFGLGKVEQAAEESGKKVSQAILFKTRLTNAQLAELTA
jgi:hypothetical protein